MSEGSAPEKPRWMELLKEAGSAGAFLYAAGFLSTRSWLNLLGVWSGPPLLDQTYLAEGAAFFVATAEKLLFPWTFLVVLALLAITAARRAWDAIRRRPPGTAPPSSAQPKVPPWLASLGVLGVLAVLLKLVDALLLEPLREPQSILLVTPRPALCPPDEYQFCVAVVAVVAVVWLSLWRGWVRLDRCQQVVRWVAFGLFAFAAFLLPMNFARTARPRLAPVAHLVRDGEKATPAHPMFLLLATDKELIVYDGESISTLDPKDVRAIEILCHASILDAPACPSSRSDARGV
ncbi:MAG TPA: hypothetical protein VF469_19820, partial [Kofleriaceae bacterium]